MNDYSVGQGFQNISDTDAKLVATEMLRLTKALARPVTPDDLLESAEQPDSPIRHLFEWDDEKAAHQYRIQQAGYIIRAVRVHIEETTYRGFVSVQTESGNGYLPLEKVMDTPNLADQVVERALNDLRIWAKRYELLKNRRDLSRVFEVIQDLTPIKSKGTRTNDETS